MQKVSLLVVAGAFAVVSSLPSFTGGVLAQGTSRAGSGNPISQAIRQAWTTAQKNITASAELMPEASYDFKPVESVRTFGQIQNLLVFAVALIIKLIQQLMCLLFVDCHLHSFSALPHLNGCHWKQPAS